MLELYEHNQVACEKIRYNYITSQDMYQEYLISKWKNKWRVQYNKGELSKDREGAL